MKIRTRRIIRIQYTYAHHKTATKFIAKLQNRIELIYTYIILN